MMKRKNILCLLFLMMFSGMLWAESGVLSYLEGRVTLEKPGGPQMSAEIGDTLVSGDTLYTDSKSFAEVALTSGSTLSIKEGSVFNFGEIVDSDSSSGKRGFFRVLLGNVSFKFKNLLHEPEIGTPLSVLAVRGTDFTVYTSPDGASLTVVSDGLVEVSSGGQTTLLAADQGVEVSAGLGLGETFDARKGFVRYDAFVKQALSRLEENPVLVIEAYTEQLENYIEEGKYFLDSFDTNMVELRAVKGKVPEIREKEGDEAALIYIGDSLGPLQERGFELNGNYRYHFISALFLRRYVISSIYIRMRTLYLSEPDNPGWLAFAEAYGDFINLYEQRLIPLLEDEDL
ncbi:MAG: hypothetical protein DRZ90_07230 [Spirochaetes bacterium]|nr:MAG: hypothetical protein DRZ90_07230 [Spirochaetota bacterium]